MSNGTIAIQGLQTGLATGAVAIGPYSIPCSATGQTQYVPPAYTNVQFDTPSGDDTGTPVGVMFVCAPAVAGATYQAGFISGQLTYLSPAGGYPCIWIFDPAHIPTSVYVTVSNTAGAYLAITFF